MSISLTVEQQAALLAITKRRAYQLGKEGMPSDPSAFGQWWREREGAASARLDATEQRARVDKERADRLEMENARARLELIPAVDVEQTVATAFAAIAADLRAIPDNLERRHGVAPDVAEQVEQALFEAMDALADRLSAFAEVTCDA